MERGNQHATDKKEFKLNFKKSTRTRPHLNQNGEKKREKKKAQLVRADLLRSVRSRERESLLERRARVRERGAVDVREDDEFEAERGRGQFGERWDRIGEDGPVGKGRCECGGGN
jgi:hypothetical protein